MEKTEKHAEFVGLHFGDGSLIWRKGTNRLRFQLRGDATTDRDHYEKFVIPLCNELIGVPILGRPVNTVFDKNRNCFGVYLESAKLNDFFEELGVPIGVKGELSIPQWIKSNSDFSKAFIRGMFDTDGGMFFRRNNTAKSRLQKVIHANICSTSKVLIQEISNHLSEFQIKHYLIIRKKSNGEKNAYLIDTYKPHVEKFMTIIGSHNPKHISKYRIWQKYGFCPSRTTPTQRQQILKDELSVFSLLPAGV